MGKGSWKRRKAGARGHQQAGRPKQDGERYSNGRLKPRPPNPKVIEMRKALMGNAKVDLSKASDPVDLAHSRGWLTDGEHRAAKKLEQLYQMAGFGPPRMNGNGLSEVQPALDIDARSFATMPDKDAVAIWDKVFSSEADEVDREQQGAAAMRLWCSIMKELSTPVREELFSVCIASSWPQWVVFMASDRPLTPNVSARRDRLIQGLGAVRQAVMRTKQKPAQPELSGAPVGETPKGPRRRELFTYVDEEGKVLLEVERITRRPADAA